MRAGIEQNRIKTPVHKQHALLSIDQPRIRPVTTKFIYLSCVNKSNLTYIRVNEVFFQVYNEMIF